MSKLVHEIAGEMTGYLLGNINEAEMEKRQIVRSFMQLLGDLKSGKIELSELSVTDEGWSIIPRSQMPPVESEVPNNGVTSLRE